MHKDIAFNKKTIAVEIKMEFSFSNVVNLGILKQGTTPTAVEAIQEWKLQESKNNTEGGNYEIIATRIIIILEIETTPITTETITMQAVIIIIKEISERRNNL